MMTELVSPIPKVHEPKFNEMIRNFKVNLKNTFINSLRTPYNIFDHIHPFF